MESNPASWWRGSHIWDSGLMLFFKQNGGDVMISTMGAASMFPFAGMADGFLIYGLYGQANKRLFSKKHARKHGPALSFLNSQPRKWWNIHAHVHLTSTWNVFLFKLAFYQLERSFHEQHIEFVGSSRFKDDVSLSYKHTHTYTSMTHRKQTMLWNDFTLLHITSLTLLVLPSHRWSKAVTA